MSSRRPTTIHRSEKSRTGERDSTVYLSLQDPLSSPKSRHSNSTRNKYERPLTSGDEDTQPNKSKPKSSKPQCCNSAGQKPSSPAQSRRVKSSKEGHHQRILINENTSEAERFRKSSHASMHPEEANLKSASPRPTRKSTSRTTSSAARPKTCHSSARGQGRRSGYISPYMDSNQQPFVHLSDLRKGNNYYLYCMAKIYDVTDMKRQKEMQYWNLLARQRQLGFHSPKECEVYMRYLSRPRTAEYSTAYSGQHRTRSTDARSQSGRKSGTALAAEDKRTVAANTEKDRKESGGERKPSAAGSNRKLDSSKTRTVSSKGGRQEIKNQRNILRDEGGEEINRRRKETTAEGSETSQNEEEIENVQKTKTRGISQSDEGQRAKEGKRQSPISLTSSAAEAGNKSDEDETSDHDKVSSRSKILSIHSDGNSRSDDTTVSVRRDTEETSSDSSDGATNHSDIIFTEVNSHEKPASQNAK